jgi:hypothetical protein
MFGPSFSPLMHHLHYAPTHSTAHSQLQEVDKGNPHPDKIPGLQGWSLHRHVCGHAMKLAWSVQQRSTMRVAVLAQAVPQVIVDSRRCRWRWHAWGVDRHMP